MRGAKIGCRIPTTTRRIFDRISARTIVGEVDKVCTNATAFKAILDGRQSICDRNARILDDTDFVWHAVKCGVVNAIRDVSAAGSVGNFVSRTIITGGQSSKVAHFLYGFSAGFGVCGGGGGGAHA